ncbi:MAG: UDP-glucose/GDP-mannose dehydrogenase family protein [archaeon]|nr:UDP-glucose/GDP-mannose dehydrogenase family protein [archaeon]
MKISVIGSGYAGLVNAVGFAHLKNHVTCADIDQKKIDLINSGKSPICEEGLEDMLNDSLKKGNIKATTNIEEAVTQTDLTFIAVGTPSNKDGSINLKYIEAVSKDIGNILKNKESYHLIIVKSTVVPGTTEDVVGTIIEQASGKKRGQDFGLAMSPEFLREGKAMHDYLNPDRIVIGAHDKKSADILFELNKPLTGNIITTDIKTAEMIKYTSNAFLAAKISFTNEIGNICKKLNIDVYDVMKGVGADFRISQYFLNAGCGFGGSCFPKDVKALIAKSKQLGYTPALLESAITVNKNQPKKMIELAKKHLGELKDKKITLLGLAFKPGTDDIREAPSITIIEDLLKAGAIITVYDPEAEDNIKAVFKDKITCAETLEDAIAASDTIMLLTEWDEFRDETLYKGKLVIDGRKTLDKKTQHNYEGICW